jgi:transposase-like protein
MHVYSREFRMKVVQRIRDGEKVPALSEELGIHRKLLYDWMRRVKEGGESNLRERGRPRKNQEAGENPRGISELEPIIEFFRNALQRIEELRHTKNGIGATASSRPLK